MGGKIYETRENFLRNCWFFAKISYENMPKFAKYLKFEHVGGGGGNGVFTRLSFSVLMNV
jgi:hypothetical protein